LIEGSRAQELFVGFALNLDQVRHLHDFVDVAEDLADSLFRGRRNCLGGHESYPSCPSLVALRRANFSALQRDWQPIREDRLTTKSAGPDCSEPHCQRLETL
jgi:hypothetical protein